jgi:peptidyl-prolyl cis-trans isomerase B (cyclophilin B)
MNEIHHILLGSALLLLMSCNGGQKNQLVGAETVSENTAASLKTEQTIAINTNPSNTDQMETAKEMGAKVKLSTEMGDMIVLLYDETPQHRDNFLKLVDEKYYDETLFHRVIAGFMVQGGDPDSKTAAPGAALGMGGPGYTIPAEFNTALYHKKGALAAARQGDQVNPEKRSSGSQFYISQGQKTDSTMLMQLERQKKFANPSFSYNAEQKKVYAETGGTPHLDGDYTVFGEVIEGLDVLDKIAAVQTDPRSRPLKDIKMTLTRIN